MTTIQYKKNSAEPLHIESARVIIVPLTERFAGDIFREFNSKVSRYMFQNTPASLENAKLLVREHMELMKQERIISCAILSRHTKEFLGGLTVNAPELSKTLEVELWLKIAARGRGFGYEAANALKSWADEHLDYEHLLFPVDRRSFRSRRMPEKLGGRVVVEKEIIRADGVTLDRVVYDVPRTYVAFNA